MSFQLGIILLAVVTAACCTLPGVFLVLRKTSMMSEAVSHAVLPGIVVALFITGSLDSPLLIVGASLAGLLVVFSTEYLENTGLLKGDAPLGLLFPAMFGIGVIMVALEFANVHLDEHVILVGDLNVAAFIQLEIGGVSVGPRYLYVLLGVLALNVAFIAIFYKELKITTFDPGLAHSLGFKPRLVNYLFMMVVSVTITASFYVAGSILTIALMIAPAAAAFLLTKRLFSMILVALGIAVTSAIGGFYTAYALDAATSGAMAVFYGLVFVLAFLFAPSTGVIGKHIRIRTQRRRFANEIELSRGGVDGA
ncbi:MAG: metal ABC transporter permease [Spirochaetales bacterium]|nr:metal ABC transporter permease [Spirochaetales bacterium]